MESDGKPPEAFEKRATEVSPLAQLRVLVAYLGETVNPVWWGSQFTTEAGLDFSKINFPRCHVSAAVAGVTVVARRIHDDRIGRKGTRHLFRFAGGLERAIHREILEADQDALGRLIESKEEAMNALSGLAQQTVDAPEGPVQVGRLGDEERETAISDLAAHYLNGFNTGRRVFPYFAGERTGAQPAAGRPKVSGR